MALQIRYPHGKTRGFDWLLNRGLRPRSVWSYAAGSAGKWPIPLNVTEDGDSVTVSATIPGVKPDDISVTIEDGVLTIEASASEKTESDDGRFLLREWRTGEFRRSLKLPEGVDVDKAESSYTDGVLRISLPKLEAKKPKQLEVKAG